MSGGAACYIGLDVGGSTMKAGVVDDDGRRLGPPVSLPTEPERGAQVGLERMCEAIREAARAAGVGPERVAALGVATPGLMDIPAGVILEAPNLGGWRDVPVRDHIRGVFGKPTAFQNDANAAAYGEYWAGAGRTANSLVLLTLGTGIGGGIVVGGRGRGWVLEGEHSHAAEVGHIRIEMSNPRRCGCGRLGCLEAYASAPAVVRRAEEALAGDGASALSVVLRRQGRLSARDVFEAAAAGDPLAEGVVEETARYLAVGTVNLMHTIDPDVVVYGGGMTAAGPGFLERVRRHVAELAFPVPAARTAIRYAELGNDAGFVGAAGCARLLLRA